MTADDLIANTRIRAGLPSPATGWTLTQILTALNEELGVFIVPKLKALNGEYLLSHFDRAIAGGQQFYALPPRCSSGALQVVKYVDVNGQEGTPLALIEVPDTGRYNITTANAPIGIFLEGNQLGLLPTPATGTGGSIRMYYTRRPGQLVQDLVVGSNHTQVATIASVTATVITTQAAHSGFMASSLIDIVSHNSPHDLLGMDVSATTAVSGSTSITVTGVDLTTLGITAGDTVTLAQTSWYPQGVPTEWHSVLELKTAARIQGSIGDLAGKDETMRDALMMLGDLDSLNEPRLSGNPKKINAWR